MEKIKLTYQNHEGLLCTHTNNVVFYGKQFKNIIDAIKTLKDLIVGEIYFTWFYNYHVGLIHDKTGQVYIDNRWLPTEEFAENYIDLKKK